MSAYLSGCLSFYLHTQIWESKWISYKMSAASNTSYPFALFLPYFFKSWLFSRKTLKLHYLQSALTHFTQHKLQVFSVCKQQIYSLSEYIPRKIIECICCTYVVECKIYKSHVIDYYPMFNSTSSLGSDLHAIIRADHDEISQMQICLRVECLSFFLILTIIDMCSQIL